MPVGDRGRPAALPRSLPRAHVATEGAGGRAGTAPPPPPARTPGPSLFRALAVEVETQLPADEARARLQTALVGRYDVRFDSTGFRVQRGLSLFYNSWDYAVDGEILAVDAESEAGDAALSGPYRAAGGRTPRAHVRTVVRARAAPSLAVRVFEILMMGFVLLMVGVAVVGSITGHVRGESLFTTFCVGLVMVVAIGTVTIAGRAAGAAFGRTILDTIRATLDR